MKQTITRFQHVSSIDVILIVGVSRIPIGFVVPIIEIQFHGTTVTANSAQTPQEVVIRVALIGNGLTACALGVGLVGDRIIIRSDVTTEKQTEDICLEI